MEVYLDNAATTKMREEALKAMASALKEIYGNPSSIHLLGRRSEDLLEEARKAVAAAIGAKATEVIFTSGASEGNNQILRAYMKEGAHFITSKIEHPSVLKVMALAEAQGVKVDYLSVNEKGQVDLLALQEKLQKNTSLVSIMMVNNETGAINDPKVLSAIIRQHSKKAKFHVDAVQGFQKIPVDVQEMDVDYLTLSAHKVHGPKGVGALYMKKGLSPLPLILGGEQEMGFRAGTVNVPGILGFAKVLKTKETMAKDYEKVAGLKRLMLESMSSIEGLRVNSLEEYTSAYILSLSIPGMRGEVFLHALSERGVYVSTGSACTAKDTKDSHVLKALGLQDKEIKGSIRLSFEEETTKEEVLYAAEAIKETVRFLRRK